MTEYQRGELNGFTKGHAFGYVDGIRRMVDGVVQLRNYTEQEKNNYELYILGLKEECDDFGKPDLRPAVDPKPGECEENKEIKLNDDSLIKAFEGAFKAREEAGKALEQACKARSVDDHFKKSAELDE